MRALAILILLASPTAFAAPGPKELKQPGYVGTWEITSAIVGGADQKIYHGHIWKFSADGNLSNHYFPNAKYTIQPDGIDCVFGMNSNICRGLGEFKGDTLTIAFANDPKNRATDFNPANNNVIYTMKRVKE